MTTDPIATISAALRDCEGLSAISRNQLLSQIRAAIGDGKANHARTPLGDHLSAAEERQLGYAVNQAISTARRMGVELSPGKPISASAFSEKARGRADPGQIIAAKSMAAAAGLMTDD